MAVKAIAIMIIVEIQGGCRRISHYRGGAMASHTGSLEIIPALFSVEAGLGEPVAIGTDPVIMRVIAELLLLIGPANLKYKQT